MSLIQLIPISSAHIENMDEEHRKSNEETERQTIKKTEIISPDASKKQKIIILF
jgi:hypothetical protein